MSLACIPRIPRKFGTFAHFSQNLCQFTLIFYWYTIWVGGEVDIGGIDWTSFQGSDLYQGRVVAGWQLTGRTDWRNDNRRLSAHSLPGYKLVASHYLITQLFQRWPNYLHVTSLVTQLSRAGPSSPLTMLTRCGLMWVISLASPGSLIS